MFLVVNNLMRLAETLNKYIIAARYIFDCSANCPQIFQHSIKIALQIIAAHLKANTHAHTHTHLMHFCGNGYKLSVNYIVDDIDIPHF